MGQVVFDTTQLAGVIQTAKAGTREAGSFFRNMYFPNTHVFETEDIYWDEIELDNKLAPLVSPIVEGKIQADKGFKMKSLKPPYLKPKHEVNLKRSFKRLVGEQITGTMTAAQRRIRQIAENLMKEDKQIDARIEQMCALSMCHGRLQLDGEQHEPVDINYERNASAQITLAGGSAWDAVDASTYDVAGEIEAWVDAATGPVDHMVMDKTSWSHFRKFKQVIDANMTTSGSNTAIELVCKDLGAAVSYKGHFGGLEIIVYHGTHEDESGTVVNTMPDATLILGHSASQNGGVAHGAIQDDEAMEQGNYVGEKYPKVFRTTGEVSRTYTVTQAAPVPYFDASAFVVVKVK